MTTRNTCENEGDFDSFSTNKLLNARGKVYFWWCMQEFNLEKKLAWMWEEGGGRQERIGKVAKCTYI